MPLKFEWDEEKNSMNIKKHGVSFEEAQSVWVDSHAVEYFDPDHSIDEDRWLRLGHSYRRILMVSFTEVKDCIRIISARPASKKEIKGHEG